MGEVGELSLSCQPSPALRLRVTAVYECTSTRVDNREQLTRIHVQGALSVSAVQAQESGDRSPLYSISLGLRLVPPPTVAMMTVGAIHQSQQCKGHKGGDREQNRKVCSHYRSLRGGRGPKSNGFSSRGAQS